MIERDITATIESLLERFPAVAVVGPRQSGKTTLARTLSSVYYDLELEADRLRLDLQWNDLAESRDLATAVSRQCEETLGQEP